MSRLAVSGSQQDRQAGTFLLDGAREPQTVDPSRHHNVGKNQIDAIAVKLLEGSFRVGDPADRIAKLLEAPNEWILGFVGIALLLGAAIGGRWWLARRTAQGTTPEVSELPVV